MADAETKTETKTDPLTVRIGLKGGVRIHFPHLFEPWAGTDGTQKPKYGVLVLIDKKEAKEDIAALQEAMKAALKKKGWVGDNRPKDMRISLRDGDEKVKDPLTGEEVFKKGPEFRGQVYFNTRSDTKPGVLVGARKVKAKPTDGIKAGDFAIVSVGAFTYTRQGAGVSFGLNNLWVTRKGEALMSNVGPSLEEDLGNVTTDLAEDWTTSESEDDGSGDDAVGKFFE